MNKTPDNNDFQDLFKIYAESSCSNEKDEDKKDDEELATEESEEVEETEEETEEVQEEGLFDRLKAQGSAAKAGAKVMGGNVKGAVSNLGSDLMGKDRSPVKTKDVGGRYADKKAHSILNSHVIKLDKALSNLASDVVKLGVMDADQAEELAQQISTEIRKSFVKRTCEFKIE
jgi:hypothetical protein